MSDPSRFDDINNMTLWDDRVLRAYMRRTFGPHRHPPKATKIYVRYEMNILRASAYYEWQASETRRQELRRWLNERNALPKGTYKL